MDDVQTELTPTFNCFAGSGSRVPSDYSIAQSISSYPPKGRTRNEGGARPKRRRRGLEKIKDVKWLRLRPSSGRIPSSSWNHLKRCRRKIGGASIRNEMKMKSIRFRGAAQRKTESSGRISRYPIMYVPQKRISLNKSG